METPTWCYDAAITHAHKEPPLRTASPPQPPPAHLQALAAQRLLRLAVVQLQQRLDGLKAEQQAARVLLAVHCKGLGRSGLVWGIRQGGLAAHRLAYTAQGCFSPSAEGRMRVRVGCSRVRHASWPTALLTPPSNTPSSNLLTSATF